MSRSTKKNPAGGFTTASSDKHCKRFANRRFRRRTRQALHSGYEPPFSIRLVSNVYDFEKDGKCWFGYHPDEEWRRFMRK